MNSGVFSTGATGAIAPVILIKRLIAPAVSTRNGKILLTLSTRNIKILNTPLLCIMIFPASFSQNAKSLFKTGVCAFVRIGVKMTPVVIVKILCIDWHISKDTNLI